MTPAIARPIAARIKANEFVEGGPHDFRLGAAGPAPRGHWSPYALSDDCRTLWWACTPEPLERADEPFYYLAQYRRATHLAESDATALPAPSGAPRTLVFSVGRCGSTLLTDLARRGGLVCLSEPDAITPLALDRQPSDVARRAYAPVVDACVEGWRAGAAARPALVKLRAQHSNAAHLRLASDALAAPRFVFVFREPRAWARSMAGHFGLPVERLRALYAGPLAALRTARHMGLDARVLTYEGMDGAAVAAAVSLDVAPEVPDASAQAGTRLAARPPADATSERTVEAFMAQWPARDARELGLPY